MSHRVTLFLILFIDTIALFFQIENLSITHHEAKVVFHSDYIVRYVVELFFNLFGQNDIALRTPMIFLHLLSTLLLYHISKSYLKYHTDRIWLILIYVMLPASNSAALLVDNAGIVLFLLLLFVAVYQYNKTLSYALVTLYLFLDISFAWLFFALFFYAVKKKETVAMLLMMLFFAFSMYLHEFNTGGIPKGHFLDTFGVYSALFSPILLLYILYVFVKKFKSAQTGLLWYLSLIPFAISLLLSFRQEIEVQLFAPYVILSLPLAFQQFFHSYRVRLKRFRYKYNVLFALMMVMLLINITATFFNKQLYSIFDNPKDHFAYRVHVAKELALYLQQHQIHCINMFDDQMQLRLQFYNIQKCNNYIFTPIAINRSSQYVTISYYENSVFYGYVSKGNNKE